MAARRTGTDCLPAGIHCSCAPGPNPPPPPPPPRSQVLTQPVNALAFLADGILYGVGGFGYAALAMVLACIPAAAAMLAGSQLAASGPAALDGQLQAVWAGLAVLMALRFATIYLPLQLRRWPFDRLPA